MEKILPVYNKLLLFLYVYCYILLIPTTRCRRRRCCGACWRRRRRRSEFQFACRGLSFSCYYFSLFLLVLSLFLLLLLLPSPLLSPHHRHACPFPLAFPFCPALQALPFPPWRTAVPPSGFFVAPPPAGGAAGAAARPHPRGRVAGGADGRRTRMDYYTDGLLPDYYHSDYCGWPVDHRSDYYASCAPGVYRRRRPARRPRPAMPAAEGRICGGRRPERESTAAGGRNANSRRQPAGMRIRGGRRPKE